MTLKFVYVYIFLSLTYALTKMTNLHFNQAWNFFASYSFVTTPETESSNDIPTDDRQITHLICVRLKHLLYDFWVGALGLLPVVYLMQKALNTPYKSHIANVLGGHRLDE